MGRDFFCRCIGGYVGVYLYFVRGCSHCPSMFALLAYRQAIGSNLVVGFLAMMVLVVVALSDLPMMVLWVGISVSFCTDLSFACNLGSCIQCQWSGGCRFGWMLRNFVWVVVR